MISNRKHKLRCQKWNRYVQQTSGRVHNDIDYPFGIGIVITPGYYARSRTMKHRGRIWRAFKKLELLNAIG